MRTLFTLLASVLFTTSLSAQVVWSTDVAPILYQHCTVCHHDGGIGPFSLMTYPQATVTGPLLEMEIVSGNMPPWPPDQTYSNFAHERILSEAEIATISAWVAGAMPEGDPALAPPPPVYSDNGMINIEPHLEITMPLHTSNATAFADDYSCFSIPSELTQNKKIRAFEVVPGNPEIVHHALIFIDESGRYPTNTSGNWRWRGEPPTIGKIYSELMSRLNDVIKDFENTEYDDVDKVYYSSDCGGIKVTVVLNEKEEPYLNVMFVLTQCESFLEN